MSSKSWLPIDPLRFNSPWGRGARWDKVSQYVSTGQGLFHHIKQWKFVFFMYEIAGRNFQKLKEEDSSTIAESEWPQAARNLGIFFPKQSSKQVWDLLIMCCIIYSALVMPFRFCFSANAEGWMLIFEAVISMIFLFDLFSCFNTAYLHHERWVVSRSRIAGRCTMAHPRTFYEY